MFSKKGLVVEKGPGWATLILPDGEFKRIKTNQYLEVGESFAYTNMSPIKYMAAAVLLFALLLSSIDYFSVKAYARVSSLAELGVNRWGRVITVKAADQNGEELLQKVKVRNDKLEVAIEKIYIQALKDEQINNSSNQLMYSIEIPDDRKLEDRIIKKMTHKLPKKVQNENEQDTDNSLDNKKKQNDKRKTNQNEGPSQEENLLLNSKNNNLNHNQQIEIEDLKDHRDKTKSVMNNYSNEADEITKKESDFILLENADTEKSKIKHKDKNNNNSSNKHDNN